MSLGEPDLSRVLNPQQLAAVTGPDGPALVLAAAGTGKTRTLVYRVAYLVWRGIAPERILLLTFTNRAAHEMLERARRLVGPRVSGVWGGTFHHMANRLLRRHAPALGLAADYTILDREDSRKLLADCVRKRGLDRTEFPRPDVLLSLFAAAATPGASWDALIEERLPDADVDSQTLRKIHEDYEQKKRKANALDFDDLLIVADRLLRANAEIAARYQEQFLHVLVDEYQDTNRLQAEMVDGLAARHRNLMVVGDDFQSIYGWRGAEIENILSFSRRYPDARSYLLETNYRSSPEILAVANACIERSVGQLPKRLRPTCPSGKRPRVAWLRDGEAQARYVAQHLAALRRQGFRASDIAVLYRAHFQSMELQMELTRARIPYLLTSGVRFFEQAHIKDACCVLRLLENPSDAMAFARLLGLLPGVGDKTAARLWTALGERFDAASEDQRKALRNKLPPSAARVWARIEPVLIAYRGEGLADDPGEVVHRFVEAYYAEYAELTFENADRRLDDLRELILYTAKFEGTAAFLSDVALLTSLEAEEGRVQAEEEDRVRLSTVHQAKGLEWRAVVILWLTEGLFPLARSLSEAGGGDAEERRLFYVAVTRARENLLLCVPEIRRTRDGGVLYTEPSRYVQELPGDRVENVRPGWV